MKKLIIIILLSLSLQANATDLYKPFIPIFPQVTNGRYFKATVMTGLSAWLVYDISRFDDISQKRLSVAYSKENIWQQNMYEQTGNIYHIDSYTPDSTFLEYSSTNSTLYDSYITATSADFSKLEADYQQSINKVWLAAIYTYSFFDALDIYYKKPKHNVNSTDALLRSIIFPGWGQIYAGSYSQAGFIYGMLIGFGGHAFYANKKVAYYDDSILPEHQSSAAKYSTERTTNLLYMLGIYFYNVLDAYVEGELANFNMDISTNAYYEKKENISSNLTINYLF